MIALSIVLALVFTVLAFIHFNWVFGGSWGLKNSIPTKKNGEKVINPGKIETTIVGIGLMTFAFYYLFRTSLFTGIDTVRALTFIGWIIPSIFLIRAIGDFKYFGFFKSIKHTDFGESDSRFFSPLCFAIAIIAYLLQFQD